MEIKGLNVKVCNCLKEIAGSSKFQIAIIFIIPAIILLPFLLGHVFHKNLYFTGYLMNSHDQNIYFGFMKQAQDGYWRFLNLPSNIVHPREYIHTLYLLQGLCSRITGIPLVFINLISSYFLAVAFGFTVRLLGGKLFKHGFMVSLFLVLMLSGSGFGIFGKIYCALFKYKITVKNMSSFPGDLWMPEMTVWNSINYTPLFIWSYLLIILIYGGIWFGESKKSFWPLIVSAISVFLIALSHSYDLVPLGFISLGLMILFRIEKKKILPELPVLSGYFLYAVAFLGAMGYQYYVLKTNPGFSVWAKKNVNLSPGFLVILMGYGVLSLGYVELIIKIFKSRTVRVEIDENKAQNANSANEDSSNSGNIRLLVQFLGLWLLVQTALLYSPFPFARRFILGIFIPLVVFFCFFIQRITRSMKPFSLLLAAFLVLISVLTPIYQLLANTGKVLKADERYFYTPEQLAAYQMMNKGLSDSDVVLASFAESNRLLRFSPAAMIAGSTQQCSEDIRESVKHMFDGDEFDLQPFISNERISYIFINKEKDKKFFERHRSFLMSLKPFFENKDYIIYKIKRDK